MIIGTVALNGSVGEVEQQGLGLMATRHSLNCYSSVACAVYQEQHAS